MVDKIAIMNRARLQKRHDRDILVKKEARELFKKYKDEPLFLSGVMLYWAEGTRLNGKYRKYQLALTNSDSKLLRFYTNFLKKYFSNFQKKDWRIGLYLYPDISPKQAVFYWSNALKVPTSQFIKSQVLFGTDTQSKRLANGICCLYINSKDACLTMQEWIACVGNLRG